MITETMRGSIIRLNNTAGRFKLSQSVLFHMLYFFVMTALFEAYLQADGLKGATIQ